MAADGTPGAKGNPRFLGAGAPSTATDLNLISDWAASVAGETRASAASLPATGNWVGREIMAEDTGALYLCTALPNTWQRIWSPGTPFAEATGTISLTSSFQTINFPVGRFTVAPLVFLQCVSGAGGAIGNTSLVASGVTASSFQARQELATSYPWAWRAIQMTPTTAEG